MYCTNNGTPDFDRLNRETQQYRNTCVDRYNPSTRSNYVPGVANPYRNPCYTASAPRRGYYDGAGRYIED